MVISQTMFPVESEILCSPLTGVTISGAYWRKNIPNCGERFREGTDIATLCLTTHVVGHPAPPWCTGSTIGIDSSCFRTVVFDRSILIGPTVTNTQGYLTWSWHFLPCWIILMADAYFAKEVEKVYELWINTLNHNRAYHPIGHYWE